MDVIQEEDGEQQPDDEQPPEDGQQPEADGMEGASVPVEPITRGRCAGFKRNGDPCGNWPSKQTGHHKLYCGKHQDQAP